MGVKIQNGNIVVTNGNVSVNGDITTSGGKIGSSLNDIGGIDISTVGDNKVLAFNEDPSNPGTYKGYSKDADENSRANGVGDYVMVTMDPNDSSFQDKTTYSGTLGAFPNAANILGANVDYNAIIKDGDHVVPMNYIMNVYNGDSSIGYYDGNAGSSFDLSQSGVSDITTANSHKVAIIKDGTYNINFSENFAQIHITNPFAFFTIEMSPTGNAGSWEIIAMSKFNENKNYSNITMGASTDADSYYNDRIGFHYGPYNISFSKEFKPEGTTSGKIYIRASVKIIVNAGTDYNVNNTSTWYVNGTQFQGAPFGFRTFYFKEVTINGSTAPVHHPLTAESVTNLKPIARYFQIARIA